MLLGNYWTAPRPPSPQAAKKKRLPTLAPWSEDKKIMCLQDNPKVKDKPSYDRYDKYKKAKTVREYFKSSSWAARREICGGTGEGTTWSDVATGRLSLHPLPSHKTSS